jgi:tetratricopeptide (TPR) repeat protein
MGRVLQFSPKPPEKFGLERVKRKKKDIPEKRGQLNLFSSGSAQVLKLATNISPFEQALMLDERGDARAGQAYANAIEMGDGVADAYCNLGIIESKAGRLTKAFDCFTRSLEHDPRHFESHYNLGTLYLDAGDLRLAKMHYDLAAELEPAFANLYFNLGLVLALLDDFPAAINALKRYRHLASPDEENKAEELLENLERSLR